MNTVLLPALDFMRIDKDQEPDEYYIKSNLEKEIEQHPDVQLFITQGYICRNVFGEIDNLKNIQTAKTLPNSGSTNGLNKSKWRKNKC